MGKIRLLIFDWLIEDRYIRGWKLYRIELCRNKIFDLVNSVNWSVINETNYGLTHLIIQKISCLSTLSEIKSYKSNNGDNR